MSRGRASRGWPNRAARRPRGRGRTWGCWSEGWRDWSGARSSRRGGHVAVASCQADAHVDGCGSQTVNARVTTTDTARPQRYVPRNARGFYSTSSSQGLCSAGAESANALPSVRWMVRCATTTAGTGRQHNEIGEELEDHGETQEPRRDAEDQATDHCERAHPEVGQLQAAVAGILSGCDHCHPWKRQVGLQEGVSPGPHDEACDDCDRLEAEQHFRSEDVQCCSHDLGTPPARADTRPYALRATGTTRKPSRNTRSRVTDSTRTPSARTGRLNRAGPCE